MHLLFVYYVGILSPKKHGLDPTFCKRIDRTSNAVRRWVLLLKKGDKRLVENKMFTIHIKHKQISTGLYKMHEVKQPNEFSGMFIEFK